MNVFQNLFLLQINNRHRVAKSSELFYFKKGTGGKGKKVLGWLVLNEETLVGSDFTLWYLDSVYPNFWNQSPRTVRTNQIAARFMQIVC